jgi:hypothetical protein
MFCPDFAIFGFRLPKPKGEAPETKEADDASNG